MATTYECKLCGQEQGDLMVLGRHMKYEHPLGHSEVSRMASMWRGGRTCGQIAAEMGRHHETVGNALVAVGARKKGERPKGLTYRPRTTAALWPAPVTPPPDQAEAGESSPAEFLASVAKRLNEQNEIIAEQKELVDHLINERNTLIDLNASLASKQAEVDGQWRLAMAGVRAELRRAT